METLKKTAEELLRSYLHVNNPKVRAIIWFDNRHKLTSKKIKFLYELANKNQDSKLHKLIDNCK